MKVEIINDEQQDGSKCLAGVMTKVFLDGMEVTSYCRAVAFDLSVDSPVIVRLEILPSELILKGDFPVESKEMILSVPKIEEPKS